MTYYGYSNKSTQFNDWIQYFCRHGSLLVTDLDFIFYDDVLKRMKIVEVKTFRAKIKDWQLKIYKTLDFALKNMTQFDETGNFEYEGFFIITMDTDTPETAKRIDINSVQVTKEQLVDFLDFKIRFEELR